MHRISLALRGFRRSHGFFAIAVLIVGLGIGMSVAIFSVFRTVLLRRLPVVDQDRIVVMWTYATDPNTEVSLGTKELSVVRQESRTMRAIAARRCVRGSEVPGRTSLRLTRTTNAGNADGASRRRGTR